MHLTPISVDDLSRIMSRIQQTGPCRVIINKEGESTLPSKALREHKIYPSIIFIRNDGWTLGASKTLEHVAYNMWDKEWVAFTTPRSEKAIPITEYKPS